jgi:SulP family sulfate permease
MAPRVQILRVSGFVFFGSTSRLLERIRERAEASSPRFLVIDLRRVSGVDSSAVVAFAKVLRLGEAHGFQTILTGASEAVRAQLERGGVTEAAGAVFEPDLDRGLERCEDALLAEPGASPEPDDPGEALAAWLPEGLAPHLERVEVPAGTVLIHQDDPPGDIYVLAEGRLSVSTLTPEGTELRLRTLRPGVVVGEIALYTGQARTADVAAQTDAVLWRCDAATIERLERTDPEVAAALHRWLAGTLADRLHDTMSTFEVLR